MLFAMAAVLSFFVIACDEKNPVAPAVVTGTITGTVTVDGVGLGGARLTLSGSESPSTTTDANGNYTFLDVPAGVYTITVSGYPNDVSFDATSKAAVISSANQVVVNNFTGMRIASISMNVEKEGNGVVTSGDGKIECGEKCSAMFVQDSETTLTASPADGWVFSHWNGDVPQGCDGQTANCKIEMDEDKTVKAIFVEEVNQTSLSFPNPIICIEHGSNQSEILWLWAFGEALGYRYSITMKVKLPNGNVSEIEVTSAADALDILLVLDIFTYGNYEWEIAKVEVEGEDIQFSGTTEGTVEVDANEQNVGQCS